MQLYCKVEDEFVPIEMHAFDIEDMEGQLVLIRVGNENHTPSPEDLQNVAEMLQSDERFSNIEGSVFFVMSMPVNMVAVGEVKEIEEQIRNGQSLKSIIEGAE